MGTESLCLQRSDVVPGAPAHMPLLASCPPALTDDCIPLLAITDATCVIHFSFPSSPKVFGGRLYCMSDHFHSLTEQVCLLVGYLQCCGWAFCVA